MEEKIEKRETTSEERLRWVMKYTDVELKNIYIIEEAYKPTTPKYTVTTTVEDKIIVTYE